MYRRILVPIDGSTTAERGLQEAIGLAKTFDASLVLLSIVEFHPMTSEMASASAWELLCAGLREHHRAVLDRAHDAARSAGVASEAHLKDAAAARVCDVILAAARDHACDLIVMGTHGRHGLERALIGSDAERVLREAPCAVLLVRTPQTP